MKLFALLLVALLLPLPAFSYEIQSMMNEFTDVNEYRQNGQTYRDITISAKPINYYNNEDGKWKRISLDLKYKNVTKGSDIYAYVNENGTYSIYFKDAYDKSDKVRFERKNFTLTIDDKSIVYRNGTNEETVAVRRNGTVYVTGSNISYIQSIGNLTPIYFLLADSIKEKIEIPQQTSLRSPTLTGSVNLTRIQSISYDDSLDVIINDRKWDFTSVITRNEVIFRSPENETIFLLPKPYLVDSKNISIPAAYKLRKAGNKIFVDWEIPQNTLSRPGLTYPLYIDPSVSANLTYPGIILDSTANQSDSTTAIPDDEQLSIRRVDTNLSNRRFYSKWNISQKIAREAEAVTSAKIEIEGSSEVSAAFGIGVHEIYRGALDFVSSSMTWLLQPCGNAPAAFNASCNSSRMDSASGPSISVGNRFNFTITNAVNRSLNKTKSLFGVFAVLFNATEDAFIATNFFFQSAEGGSGNEPQLFLTYSINPPRVNFTFPTPDNGRIVNYTYFYVNVSVEENALQNTSSFIDITNGTLGSSPGAYTMTAYWALENNTNDNSTWGNNATAYNGINCGPAVLGMFGTACDFDGANDHINASDNAGLEPLDRNFTIEAWIKPDATGARNIVNKSNSTNYYGILIDANSKAQFVLRNGSADLFTVNSTSSITAGRWTHIAGVRDSRRMLMYIDGNIEANVSADAGSVDTGSSTFMIGSGSEFVNNFDGIIDEIRIFRRALSGQEINASAKGLQLFNNFTSLLNGNYSFYAHSVDEGGSFNRTETRNITVDADIHITNITLPLVNSTNIGYGGSVNRDFTLRCDVINRGAISPNVFLIVEQNITGAWRQIATAGAAPADYLTVPSDNPAPFFCGNLTVDSSCTNSWTVSGKNTRENIGLRCLSNSTKGGGDDSLSDRTPVINIRNGEISVVWNTLSARVNDMQLAKLQELNATIKCENYFCGGVNWTARTNDTGNAPTTMINNATQVQLIGGVNNYNCGLLDTNQTCANNITANMSVGSASGVFRYVEIQGVSNNTNVSTQQNSRALVGLSGRAFLYASAYTGNIYDRGDFVIISVLVTDKDGQLVSNASVNITSFYPNNSVSRNFTGREFQKGRYNASFSISDTDAFGAYHVEVNVSSGVFGAFADSVFMVAPKLSAEQNTTLYSISANVIYLNVTLLNQSNFGRYSLKKILDDLNSTKTFLESLLLQHYDFTQEEIFLVTDSMNTINSVIEQVASGSISQEEADAKLAEIRSSLSKLTGKAVGAAPVLPIANIIIAAGVAAGTSVMILVKRGRLKFKLRRKKSEKNSPKINISFNLGLLSAKAVQSSVQNPVMENMQKLSAVSNDAHQKIKLHINLFSKKKNLEKQMEQHKQKLQSNYLEMKQGGISVDVYDAKRSLLLEQIRTLKLQLEGMENAG